MQNSKLYHGACLERQSQLELAYQTYPPHNDMQKLYPDTCLETQSIGTWYIPNTSTLKCYAFINCANTQFAGSYNCIS